MRRFLLLLALVVAGSACSGTPGTGDFVDGLTQTRPELSDDDAECVVSRLQSSYTDEQIAALIEEGSESSDAEQERFADRQLAAARDCDLEGEISPALVTAFGTANDIDGEVAGCAVGALQKEFGFWELTDQLGADDSSERFQQSQLEAIFTCGDRTTVVEQLIPQLTDQGVRTGDAACVAEEVADNMAVEDLAVLYSGDMTDQFYKVYFTALEGCDALPDDQIAE